MDHPAVDRVRAALVAAGASADVVTLDASARTAQLAADQLGCPVGAIANSLIFAAPSAAGREPVLVLTSGAHRVDAARVAALLGVARLDRADPELVRTSTGMAIGGVAPVGHPTPLRTVVDVALSRYDRVWAAAGHPRTVFATSYDDLVRLTGGLPALVGE